MERKEYDHEILLLHPYPLGPCPSQWRSATRIPAGDDRWETLWDGGVVSNTPITYVSDERPLTTARIIQVDVFNSQGELPRNLSQVSERAKDIQYASRTRLNIEQIQEIGELRAACRRGGRLLRVPISPA